MFIQFINFVFYLGKNRIKYVKEYFKFMIKFVFRYILKQLLCLIFCIFLFGNLNVLPKGLLGGKIFPVSLSDGYKKIRRHFINYTEWNVGLYPFLNYIYFIAEKNKDLDNSNLCKIKMVTSTTLSPLESLSMLILLNLSIMYMGIIMI